MATVSRPCVAVIGTGMIAVAHLRAAGDAGVAVTGILGSTTVRSTEAVERCNIPHAHVGDDASLVRSHFGRTAAMLGACHQGGRNRSRYSIGGSCGPGTGGVHRPGGRGPRRRRTRPILDDAGRLLTRYPTPMAPHVTLETRSIDRLVGPRIHTADGDGIELDALIVATGCEASDPLVRLPLYAGAGPALSR